LCLDRGTLGEIIFLKFVRERLFIVKKSRKRIFSLAVVLLAFSLMLAAYASSHSYTDTLPGLGDKTLATGTKSNSTNYATHSLSASSQSGFRWWIDYSTTSASSSWTRVTAYNNIAVGTTQTATYTATPSTGSNMRLRVGGDLTHGGLAVSGTINFN
jgi:hypothetical protein